MIDEDIRPPQETKGVFVRTCTQNPKFGRVSPDPKRGVYGRNVRADDPRTSVYFSDPGPRTFDLVTCAWVAAPAESVIVKVVPGHSARPEGDGSGVLWECREGSGQLVWTIEARNFETALAEKRYLCQVGARRSGEHFLQRVF